LDWSEQIKDGQPLQEPFTLQIDTKFQQRWILMQLHLQFRYGQTGPKIIHLTFWKPSSRSHSKSGGSKLHSNEPQNVWGEILKLAVKLKDFYTVFKSTIGIKKT